jgi:hypothetical protein
MCSANSKRNSVKNNAILALQALEAKHQEKTRAGKVIEGLKTSLVIQLPDSHKHDNISLTKGV